jgi:hypothetical protein
MTDLLPASSNSGESKYDGLRSKNICLRFLIWIRCVRSSSVFRGSFLMLPDLCSSELRVESMVDAEFSRSGAEFVVDMLKLMCNLFGRLKKTRLRG